MKSLRPVPAAAAQKLDRTSWTLLGLVLLFAAALRLMFANGALGSDDVVYLSRAIEVSRGEWSLANYNGALRYGFNIPAGLFIALFGVSEFSANLWPLLCSLGEVAAVYFFALRAWGSRAAVPAALLLAVTPLHIASAMRIHADPVVSLFLTLTFVFLFKAERTRSPSQYLLAGLCIGMVFWVKELAIVTLLAPLVYALVRRRVHVGWLYFALGGLLMLAAHLLLMQAVAGDPLHLIKVVSGQVSRSFVSQMDGEDGAFYYFKFLFADVRHTWLLAFFAVAALVTWVLQRPRLGPLGDPDGLTFAAIWLLALVAVLSFLPVSLSPLRLTMKQSNYITLFMAPLALLAGYAIARLGRRTLVACISMFVVGGVLLGALQQQAYRVFASNSRAVVAFMAANPGARVYGSTNNGNLVYTQSMLTADPGLRLRFGYLSEVGDVAPGASAPAAGPTFAVLDEETLKWGGKPARITKPLACWRRESELVPQGTRIGRLVPEAGLSLVDRLPGALAQKLHKPLEALLRPRPATLYAVDGGDPTCGQPISANSSR